MYIQREKEKMGEKETARERERDRERQREREKKQVITDDWNDSTCLSARKTNYFRISLVCQNLVCWKRQHKITSDAQSVTMSTNQQSYNVVIPAPILPTVKSPQDCFTWRRKWTGSLGQ